MLRNEKDRGNGPICRRRSRIILSSTGSSRPRIAARVMRGLFLGLLCLVISSSTRAQQARVHALSHAVRAQGGSGLDVLSRPAAPFYDVVALRVEFQPDTSRFTTGDGTFSDNLYRGLEVSIDPLPHDAGYFQAHLDFVSHYVEHVSDGRTVVNTHLVPEIVRVSMPMAAYSPIGEDANSDAELSKLATLVREAWTLASAQSSFDLSSFDPATTAFVLFHAGAGRDIELTGTTLDRTPQDLPSLFFDAATLQRLSPGPPITFNGFTVQSTMVIPETESRLGRNFIIREDFVAEFSINGFLAASFFSYLGVPDLFNAETGESAIGSFGLMDPLGIFAFNGLFPPEPSAWTKQYLGWSNPVEIAPGPDPQEVTLGAVSALGFSDAIRVPISGAEYFLVENRQRAAESDDLVLSIYRDGDIVEQRIPLDAEDFDRFNVDAFEGGVVVAANPYDRALPGTADEDVRYDGGIVIWHIDERVLRDGFASNRVNSNPDRRAVDVEEADGAQDLGFGNGGVALGTPFDFWYEGNPATAITASGAQVQLYENRFGADTFPSSNSSDGGPSFVELTDFSASGDTMTFRVELGEATAGIAPLSAYASATIGEPARLGGSIKWFQGHGSPFLIVHGDRQGAMTIFDPDSASVTDFHFGPFSTPRSIDSQNFPSAAFRLRASNTIDYLQYTQRTGGALLLQFFRPEAIRGRATAYVGPTTRAEGGTFVLATGPDTTAVLRLYTTEEGPVAAELLDTGVIEDPRGITVAADSVLAVVGAEATTANGTVWTYDQMGEMVGAPAFGQDAGGLVGVFTWPDTGVLQWLLPGGEATSWSLHGRLPIIASTDSLSEYPVLVDLDDDGYLDVLFTVGQQLVAITQSGAVVSGFPITMPTSSVAQVLVARLTESGGWSIVVAGTDGYLHAFDVGANGEAVPGFPLAVGRRIEATPLIENDTLYAVATDGAIRAWRFTQPVEVWWGQLYRDAENTSFVELDAATQAPGGAVASLLDETETYNWPNPIREGRTFLRFRTAEDAEVSIMIVDLAGALVDELDAGSVRGGVPTELEWSTDAPSGVYFARITATTASGRKESQLIRMAIIR